MSSRLKFILFITIVAIVSLRYSPYAINKVNDTINGLIETYLGLQRYVQENVSEHFKQKEQIVQLKEEVKNLKRSRTILISFAGKLNRLLEASGDKPYNPKMQLVESVSYERISNYNRVWMNMNDFNSSRIYGLISNGSTAGIVISKNNRPLGLLQGDNKCIFSVATGKDRLPGVAMGNGEHILVKYIPLWMEPKVGDEVVTSGLDNIFPIGIPVGKVMSIKKEESYQSAVVKPYSTSKTPAFFYIIK